MKRNDLQNVKGMEVKALQQKVDSLKQEIAELVIDKHMNKMTDLKTIAKKRKEVAQLLTIMRQKQLLVELADSNQEGTK